MRDTLVDQPTTRTARKVAASGWTAAFAAPLSGIVASLVVAAFPVLSEQAGNVELLLSFAITGAATWAAGYYTRERYENVVVGGPR